MPPSRPRWASTLASTGPPAALATAASRARSPGWAAGSRPTLLSPHTTRSTGPPEPCRSARLSRSLAWKRASTWEITPGWTSATRTVPAGGGAGRQAHQASAASGSTTAVAAAAARTVTGPPGRAAAATATLTAASRKLTAQTPPRAATARVGGWFHWLAPSSPHGPPNPSQERTASPTTRTLGSSASAAASRPTVGRPSSRQASQPSGSHSAPSSSASGTMNGPTLGARNRLTARKNPVPPSQARTAASRRSWAAAASSSSGASPTKASHHRPGRGKARASGAPRTRAASRPLQRPRHALTSQVHRHVLDLEVLVDALGAALAAEAGLLDPAERRRRVGHHALVEADHAGLQGLNHPEGALEVGGVDVGDQPELGVVGGGHGRLLGVEGGHRGDRAEDLLLEHPGIGWHVGQHRRLVEVASPVARPGAHHRPGALVDGVTDQLRHLVDGVLVDQQADLHAVLGATAELERGHPLGQAVGERGRHRLGHVEAVGRGAGLADVAHLGKQRAFHGGVQVGVVEDQERRVASQLHRDPQHVVGRLGEQL